MPALSAITLKTETRERLISGILRVAAAVAFVYPAVSGFMNPEAWVGFLPLWLRDIVPNDTLFLHAFGAFEIALACWILSAKRVRVPGLIASALMASVIAFNWQFSDIVFRDVSVLAVTLVLALRSK